MLSSVYCELSSYLTQQYGENEGMQFFINFVISFNLQSAPVHSANCAELIQWHVEQYSVAMEYYDSWEDVKFCLVSV
jgi:hypothetical protein